MKLNKKIDQNKTQKRHFQFQNDNTSFEIDEFNSTNISIESKHLKNYKPNNSLSNIIQWFNEIYQLVKIYFSG